MNYLIGHLVGDYLLQNDYMALAKKERTWHGRRMCLLHCVIWTLCVMSFAGWMHQSWKVWLAVFLSHWILDRTHFEKRYKEFMGIFTYIAPASLEGDKVPSDRVSHNGSDLKFWVNRSQWIEHAAIDNSIHLMLLYFIATYMVR